MSFEFEEFSPENLVAWADSMADKATERMEPSERTEVMRVITHALLEAGILSVDRPGAEDASFQVAGQLLYICRLLPKIFPLAYHDAEIEVTLANRRDDVEESFRRSLEL